MKKIGSFFKNDFLNKKRDESKLDQETMFFIFKEVIKKELGDIGSEHFQPSYFSKKTIFVKSKSPAWASELRLNQERVIEKINKKIGKTTLEKIKIQ